MGLAEPRKRRKIGHDPRNLAWSEQSAGSSYGHRLMTQQGWTEGQALGARNVVSSSTTTSSARSGPRSGLATDAERLAAARVGVLFKDDNLGLGATRRVGGAADVEAQRTGFDAFQGLLGRLNGKADDVHRREEEEGKKKREEKRLEMFFRGRWGGMVFIKGGVLVGNQRETEESEDLEEKGQEEEHVAQDVQEGVDETEAPSQDEIDGKISPQKQDPDRDQRRRLKAAKKQRKEEKRRRKEEKTQRKARREGRDAAAGAAAAAALPTHRSPISISHPPDEPVSSAPSEDDTAITTKGENKNKNKKKRKLKPEPVNGLVGSESSSRPSSPSVLALKNGRHLLRGRNIQAKKMVLADAKGLDQIFMR
ncbi:Pin2-interacting protein X1 [Cladophialophora carrionii]|uniref:Pin2-interacting protein X1 n=1 Tax=Cladophialophora carrionii TaxID=86049 RepID=A0A1C1D154_9EURO|nr:Pin2-interacting protein X1 [Cladophialophora carrionii]